ncbi:hypothetical protein [Alkanindiges illinoisensis]|uniref:Uncharacterized protein n=1 Tax=Alkanindiges illinoisensis TaxID=197183 RepID=A0A4Y7XA76_9GAMM|nr:hypothetical protein [Alkanindiges illinoisensis]TEU24921.1 hypothetical protein E2B99_11050 [Alkanindiges illinoisensis]
MKKLMIAALLVACTTSAFAEIQFKIGKEYIVPKFETQKSLTVKLGQPSSTSGNTMIWKKGAAVITAEFKNGKLYNIYSNFFENRVAGRIEETAEFTFLPGINYAVVNTNAFVDTPILSIGNTLNSNFCLASRWINKADRTIRYVVKKPGVDNGSFYWSADTTQDAINEWNTYRKDTRTQGMGIASRVGWINEPVNYDVKKCY